ARVRHQLGAHSLCNRTSHWSGSLIVLLGKLFFFGVVNDYTLRSRGWHRKCSKTTVLKRVLIVDDEAIVLTVLRDFFASFRHEYAYEITTAESATEAFQILRREQFDLILLDVVIPAATGRWLSESNLGFSLLARLRGLGVTAPVLVMTGGGSSAKEAEALNAGAAGFLYKPVGLRELDHAVTRALRSASGGISASIVSKTSIRRWSGPTPTSNAG